MSSYAVIAHINLPETMGGELINELIISRHVMLEQAQEVEEEYKKRVFTRGIVGRFLKILEADLGVKLCVTYFIRCDLK